jgi:succinyl-diaminopimelate desuccinylase
MTQSSPTTVPDVAALAEALIACPSVTPAEGLVFDCLERQLVPHGFQIHRFTAGIAPDGPVENLFAVRRARAGPARRSLRSAGATSSTAGARST